MTWNEFNKQIDSMGFEREEWNGMTVILNVSSGNHGEVRLPVAKISKTKRFEFDMMGFRELDDMSEDRKEHLYNVLDEYARTQLEYRE